MPQYPVDKACHVFIASTLCLFDRLIDSSAFRDPVHEKYLVKGDTKDV